MRNLISKIRYERLRNVFAGVTADEGPEPTTTEVLEVQEAIVLAEAMVSDILSHCRSDEGFQSQDSVGQNSLLSTNILGRQLKAVELPSVAESIAAGAGMAMTGLRSAVFLPGDHLAEGYSQLQLIATRHVPVVVHAAFREGFGAGSSHSGYHGASDLGLFQVMPSSVQQAIDMTLLARWIAERSLIPGLVGFDRRVVESAGFPSADVIRQFLGSPDDDIQAPSAAQLLLFGGTRSRIPKWFDHDRPVSFGALQGSNDGASAAIGRQVFFLSHLPLLVREGMEEYERLTGRRLSLLEQDMAEDADLVLVTQGSAYQTARAAARYLRQEKRKRVGVLGLTWLRPFPAAEIRTILNGKRGVAVLECAGSALAEDGPLMREMRRAVTEIRSNWISATFGLHGQPLAVGQVIQLVSELEDKRPRSRVWLGIVSGPEKLGDFPKREGLIRSVASDYPELKTSTISANDVEKLSSPGLKTLQWVGSSSIDVSGVLNELARIGAEAGDKVRGFGWFPEPGVFSARVSAGDGEIPISEGGTAVDVLILGRPGLDLIYNPLSELKENGAVVIESDRNPQEIWNLMPDFWRSEIKRLSLRIYQVEPGHETLIGDAARLLSNSREPTLAELDWNDLLEPSEDLEEVPQLIRRVKESGPDFDNLPRFWGEVMQPKRGGISDNFPDPLVTVDAVPPYSAALARPRGTALPSFPVLDPERCTGCGQCWPVCPDSAIGATLISIQEVLDGAAELTGMEGKIAGTVKRSHRPLAGRVTSLIKKKKAEFLTQELLQQAFESVLEKLPVSDEDRPEYRKTFAATAAQVARVSPVVTKTLFESLEEANKGGGQLLILVFNPDACQGCQLCISSCPESALSAQDRAGSVKLEAASAWKVWEKLPDTAGALLEQLEQNSDLDKAATQLLSRYTCQVQAVGSFGEPGSGERLACRLLTGLAEAHVQRKMADQADRASQLGKQLREQVQSLLAKGLVDADSEAIETTLADLPRHRVSLSELSDRLASLGKSVSVDPVKTLRLAKTAHDLETENWNLTEGVHGLGRSRFGVVVVSQRIARWAGRFPNHPYHAPLVVEPSPDSAGLIIGLAEAATLRYTEKIRNLHRGQLYLENPNDLPGRLAGLEDLSWNRLSAEEKEACPPLIVLADETALSRIGLGVLSRLLSSHLPVKLVILDSRSADLAGPEPTLFGLGFEGVFILSGSLGYRNHLAQGVERALAFTGPALIHIHVPIPQEQGFEPIQTLERARQAVEARVHPLMECNPAVPGSFGTRISIDANPKPDQEWADSSPVEWALREKRFQQHFTKLQGGDQTSDVLEYLSLDREQRSAVVPVIADSQTEAVLKVDSRMIHFAAKRKRVWSILQEVAGVKSPFVDQIRDGLKARVEAENRELFDSMKQDYEAKILAIQRDVDSRMAQQLRDRLLSLAGFGSTNAEIGKK